MAAKRRIFAMGGGGFAMEPENPRLDDFVLGLVDPKTPRVCLIPTASGDSDSIVTRFQNAFPRERADASVLSLFRGTVIDVRAHLLAQDIIYVTGGNTRNMLALWKLWGVDTILREAYEAGIVLAGLSAGSICWFEHGITDSWPGELRAMPCLGFLRGSHCPHYDGEANRRPTYQRLIAAQLIPDGLAADDGVGLLYEDEQLVDVVRSRENVDAWRVEHVGGTAIETRIPARML